MCQKLPTRTDKEQFDMLGSLLEKDISVLRSLNMNHENLLK